MLVSTGVRSMTDKARTPVLLWKVITGATGPSLVSGPLPGLITTVFCPSARIR